MPKEGSKHKPKSEQHRRLGVELRRVRQRAGKNIRDIEGFSDTTVSHIENGLIDASPEFIEIYIGLGGDRVRLLSMFDATQRSSKEQQHKRRTRTKTQAVVQHSTALTPDSDFHELRRLYQPEELDDYYLIGSNKAVSRATHVVRVRPLVPDSRYYVCAYGSGESGRRGVLTLQTGQGCALAKLDENERGVLHFVLDFNPAGRPAEDRLYEFAFTIDFHDDDPMVKKPMLRNSTRSGIRRVVKRVQFTEPALPKRVWWFQEVELLDTERDPQPEQVLPLNAAHFYMRDFNDLVDEYVGLAWEWA